MTKNKTMALLTVAILTFTMLFAARAQDRPFADGLRPVTEQQTDAVVVDSVSVAAQQNVMPEKPVIYQSGKATHYGDSWNGRKCASGERYDINEYTCAHRTLPFGTLIKVTNTRNGKSAVVRVIDRGPFGKGKVIDLSKAAARKIGMLGVGIVPVTLELVPEGTTVVDGEIVPPGSEPVVAPDSESPAPTPEE